jgi:DNA-3-methyladenine glycosylase I
LIARYDEADFIRLMSDAGIIRNKAKIRGTIINAGKFLEIQTEFGTFDRYIWQFTKGRTINNKLISLSSMPVKSPESDAMSKDLVSRGFKFAGSTICYAFMQAAGMVNDHLIGCHRYQFINSFEKNNV